MALYLRIPVSLHFSVRSPQTVTLAVVHFLLLCSTFRYCSSYFFYLTDCLIFLLICLSYYACSCLIHLFLFFISSPSHSSIPVSFAATVPLLVPSSSCNVRYSNTSIFCDVTLCILVLAYQTTRRLVTRPSSLPASVVFPHSHFSSPPPPVRASLSFFLFWIFFFFRFLYRHFLHFSLPLHRFLMPSSRHRLLHCRRCCRVGSGWIIRRWRCSAWFY